MADLLAQTAVAPMSPDARKQLKRVTISAAIGTFVEWFDFTVYAYTAVALAAVFFPSDAKWTGLLLTFAIYAVGFVFRPLGGVFFSHFGDTTGRRGVLAWIIIVMGMATFGIGMLPSYARIGMLAPLLLVALRCLQGFSAGAEAMGSSALVQEHAPKRHQGFFTAFAYTFANIPPVVAALLVLFLTNAMSDAAYLSWGWRIPFFIGGAISVIGLYIRKRVKESPAFVATKKAKRVAKAPVAEVVQKYPKELARVFGLATLAGLGFYSLSTFFVTYLITGVGLTSNQALISNACALTVAFILMPVGGLLSDRFGRKKVLAGGAIGSAICAVPAYMLAGTGSLWGAIVGQSLLAVPLAIYWGPVAITYLESFPTRVRFTGAALGYNLAYVCFGGTAALIGTWLVGSTGSLLSPAYYFTAVAVAAFIVALIIPETYRKSTLAKEDLMDPEALGVSEARAAQSVSSPRVPGVAEVEV